MSRYVDIDKPIIVNVYDVTDNTAFKRTVTIAELLEGTVDVLEEDIVRCKECKHKYIEDMVWRCPFGMPGGPGFYCGYSDREVTG